MNTKILPIVRPPIIGYVHLAYPLSILLNYSECLPWYYSNFIQLCCCKIPQEANLYLRFYTTIKYIQRIPWLMYEYLHLDTIINNGFDIIKLICNYIDEGYYIYINVDELYISQRGAYGRNHNTHANLVFGYDLSKKTFNILGFAFDHKFRESEVSFSDFEKAVRNYGISLQNKNMEDFNVMNFAMPLKYNSYAKYDFDMEVVKKQIYDYLHSRNTTEFSPIFKNHLQFESANAFGLDIYQHFKRYLELMLDDAREQDFVSLHVLWEHKKCMCSRIKYMMDNKYIPESFDTIYKNYCEIEHKTLSLRNHMLKYIATNDKKVIVWIIKSIDEIAIKESSLLSDILDNMQVNEYAGK